MDEEKRAVWGDLSNSKVIIIKQEDRSCFLISVAAKTIKFPSKINKLNQLSASTRHNVSESEGKETETRITLSVRKEEKEG